MKKATSKPSAEEKKVTDYTSRICIIPSHYTNKEGVTENVDILVSFNNYFFVNQSKSGKIFGRMKITGDWNLKILALSLGVEQSDMDKEGEWLTLFFSERDEKYLQSRVNTSISRPFHGRITLKEDGDEPSIVCNVSRLD